MRKWLAGLWDWFRKRFAFLVPVYRALDFTSTVKGVWDSIPGIFRAAIWLVVGLVVGNAVGLMFWGLGLIGENIILFSTISFCLTAGTWFSIVAARRLDDLVIQVAIIPPAEESVTEARAVRQPEVQWLGSLTVRDVRWIGRLQDGGFHADGPYCPDEDMLLHFKNQSVERPLNDGDHIGGTGTRRGFDRMYCPVCKRRWQPKTDTTFGISVATMRREAAQLFRNQWRQEQAQPATAEPEDRNGEGP
ncbi:MAG: hypothetical protein WEB00_13220 [Dehalococcoidia bacterium]